MPIKQNSSIDLIYDKQEAIRLDKCLSELLTDYSRSFFQKLIYENHVSVNGSVVAKPNFQLKSEARITIFFPDIKPLEPHQKDLSQTKVEIIFEHADFFIINKPAGLLSHAPSLKSTAVTLVDWLITYCSELKHVGLPDRPGIVHRLDKETSGLMIIPRNGYSHMRFGELFKDRKIHKTYLACVEGLPESSGSIDYRIARHPTDMKMTHIAPHGRDALTHFKVLTYFEKHALIEAKPVTGRTHQIRVHFSAIGHPLVGDAVYGKQSLLINRHALHAAKLEFEWKEQKFNFECAIPEDIQQLITKL